jgi:hypothetical protein
MSGGGVGASRKAASADGLLQQAVVVLGLVRIFNREFFNRIIK